MNEDQPLQTGDGSLVYGSKRDCITGEATAFEFYNLGPALENDPMSDKRLVSANTLIDGEAAFPVNDSGWHEFSAYTLRESGNRFDWKEVRTDRISLSQDGCGFDRTDAQAWDMSEFRRGVVLQSGYRTDPQAHDRSTWLECNYGSPDDSAFSHCEYIRFEVFVPTSDLATICTDGRSTNDDADSRGVVKLVSDRAYIHLADLAKNRWDPVEENRQAISPQEFSFLVSDTPKLCMRTVDQMGNSIAGRSSWRVFGHVIKLHCE